MTPEADVPVPLLTAAERARLRPTVDAEAFERFLAEIPDDVRPGVQRAAVLHFSRGVSMADIRDFLSAVGNDDAAAAVGRAVDADAQATPAADTETPVAPADRLFTMEPPDSPDLRVLWDAIEPPGSPAG
jgi:hypothetical protein